MGVYRDKRVFKEKDHLNGKRAREGIVSLVGGRAHGVRNHLVSKGDITNRLTH